VDFNNALPPLTHNVPTYYISAKSEYPGLSYFRGAPNKTMLFRDVSGPNYTKCGQAFNTIGQCGGWVINDSINSQGPVFRGSFGPPIFQRWERLISNLERR